MVAAIGVACIAIAVGANQRWLDRHFLPSFLWPRHWYTLIETSVRVGLGALGAWIVTGARARAGRFALREPSLALSVAAAMALALGAGEIALKYVKVQPAEWLFPDEEPRRQLDARLGWTFVPSRAGHKTIGGRDIAYTFDSHGYRVRSLDEPTDPDRPAILFTGESVMVGEGLTWEESVPARVSEALGVQSANLAVHGYSTDQAYLRLEAELPRFRKPVAVVALFMTGLFGRNFDRDRPHLLRGLVWQPPRPRSRLTSLAQVFVPYRSNGAIETNLAITREVLLATTALARAHGATPLILVPQFGHDDERDQALRRQIFDGARLPYVFVEIDPTWRIPWDRHPDARAARAMADAVVEVIRDARALPAATR
ncbi:MAG TPA: hypothetical protein VEP46_17045 [Vicinamibacterales bacterium]|nr:hypothetical protein [Vicinamibacterales bacterium]